MSGFASPGTHGLTLDALFGRASFAPNPAQRQAIEHHTGPLFLVAGPGSGKTRVLLWRTVNLVVFHEVPPEEIFLSTFTEKAAKQLQDGLIALLALAAEVTGLPYDLSKMYVGTVHSLCSRILQDRALSQGRERVERPAVHDALDQYFHLASGAFWRDAISRLGFEGEVADLRQKVNDFFEPPHTPSRHKAVVNLAALFNRLSEENLSPSELLARATGDDRLLFELYEVYRERLGERRVDLSLLQQAAYRTLCCNSEAPRRFRHVIIDEYQDTNAIQERIFLRLASGSGNLCVVGDDDQALYRFRGATVENFVQFPDRCISGLGLDPRRIELNINYRSRNEIVEKYTTFIEGADWRRPEGGFYRLHDKGVKACSDDKAVAVIASTPADPEDVALEIAGLVRSLIDAGRVSDPNQIAFLFPSLKSTAVDRFERALQAVGLKVYAPRAKRFLEADEPTIIVGLLSLIVSRPARDGAYDKGEYHDFHVWLDAAEARARALVHDDPLLARFVRERSEELRTIQKDYAALQRVLSQAGWTETSPYDPSVHKRALLAAGLSTAATRALGGTALDRLQHERAQTSTPLLLANVINRATAVDWGLLDLFYRFIGFDHLRALVDLANGGSDEGPICNLSLTSQLLARYVDTFPAVITASGLEGDRFQQGFYHGFLFALFRIGEGEYEDAEDPFPRGRIPFLTVHQAKGLEFPVVVLGSARTKRAVRRVEELVRPYLPPGGEPIDRMPEFDTMRLFYVALSRAMNLLVIAHPKGRGQRIDPAFHTLLDGAVARVPSFNVQTAPVSVLGRTDVVRRYSYTGDYLSYLRCPRQYMIFERYGFAASRTQTMFFGSLVHQTIEDLHNRIIAAREPQVAR